MADDDSNYESLGEHIANTQRQTQKMKEGRMAKTKNFGSSLRSFGQSTLSNVAEEAGSRAAQSSVSSYRKGGKVRKTGLIKAHRGEEVVSKKNARKVRKFLKRTKDRKGKEREM